MFLHTISPYKRKNRFFYTKNCAKWGFYTKKVQLLYHWWGNITKNQSLLVVRWEAVPFLMRFIGYGGELFDIYTVFMVQVGKPYQIKSII